MSERDFKQAVKAFDEEAKQVPSAPSSSRVWSRLAEEGAHQTRQRQTWFVAGGARVALGVLAASVVIALGYVAWSWLWADSVMLAGFDVNAPVGTHVSLIDNTLLVEAGPCELRDESAILSVEASSKVRREAQAIRVVKGKLLVTARPRHRNQPPLRVLVSRGSIEVMGTRFTVIEEGERGEVTLHEGVIRFVRDDGEVIAIGAGETVRWPSEKAVEPAPDFQETTEELPQPDVAIPEEPAQQHDAGVKPPKKIPVKKRIRPEARDEVGTLLERVAELRDRGEFDEAIKVLKIGARRFRDLKTRERLSFEVGSILSHQLAARVRACSHWKEHTASFQTGRYANEIKLLQNQLGCEHE